MTPKLEATPADQTLSSSRFTRKGFLATCALTGLALAATVVLRKPSVTGDPQLDTIVDQIQAFNTLQRTEHPNGWPKDQTEELKLKLYDKCIDALFPRAREKYKVSSTSSLKELNIVLDHYLQLKKDFEAELVKRGVRLYITETELTAERSSVEMSLIKITGQIEPNTKLFTAIGLKPIDQIVYEGVLITQAALGTTVTLGLTTNAAWLEGQKSNSGKKDEIVIFTQEITKRVSPENLTEAIETVVTNEYAHAHFQHIVDGKYSTMIIDPKNGFSVSHINEAFSDYFSLQSGSLSSFKNEVARIVTTNHFDYGFSRLLMSQAINAYATEIKISPKELIDLIIDNKLSDSQAGRFRTIVTETYGNNSLMKSVINGTLNRLLESLEKDPIVY